MDKKTAPIRRAIRTARPERDFCTRLSRVVTVLAARRGWSFGCMDADGAVAPLDVQTVASPSGLLPLLTHAAAATAAEAFGTGFDMTYRLAPPGQEADFPCGVSVEPPAATASLMLWSLFIGHALDEAAEASPKGPRMVMLDGLYERWMAAYESESVALLPPIAKPTPAPAMIPAPRPVQGMPGA